MKDFDYYIFIDYSDDLVGYIAVENKSIRDLLPKISKLHHYKDVKYDEAYILAVRKRFEKEGIISLLSRFKINEIKTNIDIFAEIIDFLRKNESMRIFISIDDNFYISFMKFVNTLENKNNLFILRESKLKKYSIEYKLNLIIDNALNIERRKRK